MTQKYEYKCYQIDEYDKENTKCFELVLNNLGLDGWDMCSGTDTYLFFKRPIKNIDD